MLCRHSVNTSAVDDFPNCTIFNILDLGFYHYSMLIPVASRLQLSQFVLEMVLQFCMPLTWPRGLKFKRTYTVHTHTSFLYGFSVNHQKPYDFMQRLAKKDIELHAKAQQRRAWVSYVQSKRQATCVSSISCQCAEILFCIGHCNAFQRQAKNDKWKLLRRIRLQHARDASMVCLSCVRCSCEQCARLLVHAIGFCVCSVWCVLYTVHCCIRNVHSTEVQAFLSFSCHWCLCVW